MGAPSNVKETAPETAEGRARGAGKCKVYELSTRLKTKAGFFPRNGECYRPVTAPPRKERSTLSPKKFPAPLRRQVDARTGAPGTYD